MKTLLSTCAVGIVIIAINMSWDTIRPQKFFSSEEVNREVFARAQIVKVLGKYHELNGSTGYLVTTRGDMYVVPYDEGSYAAAAITPEYASVYWSEDLQRVIVIPGMLSDISHGCGLYPTGSLSNQEK